MHSKKKRIEYPKTCEGCEHKIMEPQDDDEDLVSCELGNDAEVMEDLGCKSYK